MSERSFPSFFMFRGEEGLWQWRLAIAPGSVLAVSAVGYQQRKGCIRAIRAMQALQHVPVYVRHEDLGEETVEELILRTDQILKEV